MRDIGQHRARLDPLGAVTAICWMMRCVPGAHSVSPPDWRPRPPRCGGLRSVGLAFRLGASARRGEAAPLPAPTDSARADGCGSRAHKPLRKADGPHPVPANSSLGAALAVGRCFRKDSAGPSHSRSSGASTPIPKPAQAETQRPGHAHQAAAPEQLRIHSTEDSRRRAEESEKGWQAQCLQKV